MDRTATLVVLGLVLSAGCDRLGMGRAEVMVLEVGPDTVPCLVDEESRCFLVREEGEDRWSYSSSAIQGFTHEAGHVYRLQVERRPGRGLAEHRYRLLSVLSAEPSTGAEAPR